MKNPAASLLLAALFCAGCSRPPSPSPGPDAGSSKPLPHAEGEAPQGSRPLAICVLVGGRLEEVPVTYDAATRGTLYRGRLFREAFPESVGYAVNETWYVNNEPILWEQRTYVKFGLPRVAGVSALRPVAEHRGVMLFAEIADTPLPGVLYVPVGTGCLFQLYQWDLRMRAVRG